MFATRLAFDELFSKLIVTNHHIIVTDQSIIGGIAISIGFYSDFKVSSFIWHVIKLFQDIFKERFSRNLVIFFIRLSRFNYLLIPFVKFDM